MHNEHAMNNNSTFRCTSAYIQNSNVNTLQQCFTFYLFAQSIHQIFSAKYSSLLSTWPHIWYEEKMWIKFHADFFYSHSKWMKVTSTLTNYSTVSNVGRITNMNAKFCCKSLIHLLFNWTENSRIASNIQTNEIGGITRFRSYARMHTLLHTVMHTVLRTHIWVNEIRETKQTSVQKAGVYRCTNDRMAVEARTHTQTQNMCNNKPKKYS